MTRRAWLWAVVLGSVAAAARPARAVPVTFKTSDGITIAGDFHAPKKGKPVFLLLHGLGAGKGEWAPFVSGLKARGYGSLAIDARGHGQSGGPSFRTFHTPRAWERLGLDIEAALHYLARRGYPRRRVVLGGASIGANLMLEAAERNPEVPFALLFSPGEDYQGIKLEGPLRAFDRPLLLAAAPTDPYSLQTCLALAPFFRSPASKVLQAGSGHGAQMFTGAENQDFMRSLFQWIDVRLSGAVSLRNRASP